MEVITRVELNCDTKGWQDRESVAIALRQVAEEIEQGNYSGIVGWSQHTWSIDIDEVEDENLKEE